MYMEEDCSQPISNTAMVKWVLPSMISVPQAGQYYWEPSPEYSSTSSTISTQCYNSTQQILIKMGIFECVSTTFHSSESPPEPNSSNSTSKSSVLIARAAAAFSSISLLTFEVPGAVASTGPADEL